MITDNDIKKLETHFATKFELHQLRDELLNKMDGLATKDDLRDCMTKIENVYGEIKKMREESLAHFHQHEEIYARLDQIESVPVIAQAIKKPH